MEGQQKVSKNKIFAIAASGTASVFSVPRACLASGREHQIKLCECIIFCVCTTSSTKFSFSSNTGFESDANAVNFFWDGARTKKNSVLSAVVFDAYCVLILNQFNIKGHEKTSANEKHRNIELAARHANCTKLNFFHSHTK